MVNRKWGSPTGSVCLTIFWDVEVQAMIGHEATSCLRLMTPLFVPQALRSCHPWIMGTPLGDEALPQPGLKCLSSVVVMALRTSDSAAEVAAAARPWAEMTAQTTCSCGGCEPALVEGVSLPSVAQDSPVHLPSACLPLPRPHANLEQSVRAGPYHADSVSSLWKHSW